MIGHIKSSVRKRVIAIWLGFASCLILGAALGYGTGPSEAQWQPVARMVEKPVDDATGMERLRKQVALLTSQRDCARAALADTQRRLRGTRRTISRYREELASVDELNASLRREAR